MKQIQVAAQARDHVTFRRERLAALGPHFKKTLLYTKLLGSLRYPCLLSKIQAYFASTSSGGFCFLQANVTTGKTN